MPITEKEVWPIHFPEITIKINFSLTLTFPLMPHVLKNSIIFTDFFELLISLIGPREFSRKQFNL